MALLIGCLLPASYAAYTDIKKRILSDKVTLPIIFAGLLYALYAGTYKTALMGAGFGFIVFFLTAWITNGIGGGDIKLATGVGMWFGFKLMIQIVLILSMAVTVYKVIESYYTGRLEHLWQECFRPLVRGLFLEYYLKIKHAMPVYDEKMPIKKTVPYGAFLTITAWLVFVWRFLI